MTQANTLFNQHQALLNAAIAALKARTYYTPYPEHPKAYNPDGDAQGKEAFSKMMSQKFELLHQGEANNWGGDEVSPYLQLGLGIQYPLYDAEQLLQNAETAATDWSKCDVNTRAGILIESLERVKNRFFEIAYATMHTTGQSFMMSFQASGPHANDRALEAIAAGYEELTRYPQTVEWVKPMGKFDIKLNKNWKPVPKGISLVIGCSTFPTWNTVPGMYASLITGNPVIVKPHPKAILPIALVISELQNVLKENGLSPLICQLAADTVAQPITKTLAEDARIKLIDYTGSSLFGEYIESLPNKTVFTEKAGVNSCFIHSVNDLNLVAQNIAFSLSLYSGQMCTATQNIFIPAEGVEGPNGIIPYQEVVMALSAAIEGLVNHPKAGAATLGGIQSDQTLQRVQQAAQIGGKVVLASNHVHNEEFEHARTASPVLLEVEVSNSQAMQHEHFGPIALIIKCETTQNAIDTMQHLAATKGAITCSVYCTNPNLCLQIEETMNAVFTPVSFNFTGAIFVNQHAAFSDFHVTGGNPAGNASFTNPDFVNRRFVWVGNRYN